MLCIRPPARTLTILLTTMIVVAGLSGCGQKGPLYFPQDDQAVTAVPDEQSPAQEPESTDHNSDDAPMDAEVATPPADQPFPSDLQPADS